MRRIMRKGGFTLLETMIAISIIGLLAAVAIPAFRNYQNRSKRSESFANLDGVARLEKAYFGEYATYVDSGLASYPAGVPTTTKQIWDAASDAAYSQLGFHPEGAVYYTYDVNVDLAVCPQKDCFTASAIGDADGNGLVSLMMYVQPSGTGATALSLFYPALGLPLDPVTAVPRINEVAVNYQADLY